MDLRDPRIRSLAHGLWPMCDREHEETSETGLGREHAALGWRSP
jgi:hypothetical protein